MRPFREHAREWSRAWLPRRRRSLKRSRRASDRGTERSARELAAVAALGLAAGVVLEFFLDPRSGRRRRHLARDRATAALRRRARRVERHTHYETGRVVGLAHKITHRNHHHAPELDDVSLVRKVESELFRDRTIPKGQISINADRGIVVLRGQLEDQRLIRRIESDVRTVAGVRDVENLLHPATIPTR
jgi:hyperosmotically inducible periplasmic protein